MNDETVVGECDEEVDGEIPVALAHQTEKHAFALRRAKGTGLGWVLEVRPVPGAKSPHRGFTAKSGGPKKPASPRTYYYARVEHALSKLCDMALADSGKLDGTIGALIEEAKRIRAAIIEPWGKGV